VRGSEGVSVFCEVLWVVPKECVFCEVLCMGTKKCVCVM